MKKLCIIALLFLNFNCFVLEPDNSDESKEKPKSWCNHYIYFEVDGQLKTFINNGGFDLIWNDYWENYWYQPGEFLSDYNKLKITLPANFKIGYTYTYQDLNFGLSYLGSSYDEAYSSSHDPLGTLNPTLQLLITAYDGIIIEGTFNGTLNIFDPKDNATVIGQILITNGSFKSTVGLYYCDQLSADYGCVCY